VVKDISYSNNNYLAYSATRGVWCGDRGGRGALTHVSPTASMVPGVVVSQVKALVVVVVVVLLLLLLLQAGRSVACWQC
jgi:hypothetical protein